MKTSAEKHRPGEYIANIIFNLIFLWILSRVPHWNIGWLKDNYMVVLLILQINSLAQIAGNIIMLVFKVRMVRYIASILMEIAGFVAVLMLYYLYPFDFSGYSLKWLDVVLPILFIVGMVVSAVKIVTYTIQLFVGLCKEEKVPKEG